jgi:hypothetical protein
VVEAYRRNQQYWALWQFFAANTPTAKPPPKIFRTRIKRLLEVDRAITVDQQAGGRFAFFNSEGPGLGADVDYSAYGVFALALGLDMLDAGFKQSETVELLRACRPDLQRHYSVALKNPPVPAEHVPAEDRPGCPTYDHNGISCADCRIFMVMQKVETIEALPLPKKAGRRKAVIMRPAFYRGLSALSEELHTMPNYYRKVFILEFAETAVLLTHYLGRAPRIKRGRGG